MGFLIIINVMTHAKILQYISQGQYFSDIKAMSPIGYQTSIKGQVTTVATGKAYIE